MVNSTYNDITEPHDGDPVPVLSYWPRLPRRRSMLDSMDILLTVTCAIFILLCVSLLLMARIVSGHWV